MIVKRALRHGLMTAANLPLEGGGPFRETDREGVKPRT